MSFLPVVERELRAAARRRSTFRVRSWTVVLAVTITVFGLFFVWVGSGGRSPPGSSLFVILTGYAFFLCSIAGVFLSSNSIAEEKRDGTLGLLFLTNLKGYDVVFGKFAGLALNPFYALLSLVPVTGFPLLLGGVTGAEFWRSAVSLANTLFVSLSAGMFISSASRGTRGAFGGTFLFLIVLNFLLPTFGDIVSEFHWPSVLAAFTWLSPSVSFFYVMDSGYAKAAHKFWITIVASNLLGWIFLCAASVILPRSWQDRIENVNPGGHLARFWNGGSRPGRGAAREKRALAGNPIFWLASADSGSQRIVWVIVLFAGAVFLFQTVSGPSGGIDSLKYSTRVCGFVLKILVGIQACRFFVEHRRNGGLELLLSTPLRSQEIVKGQTMALRRFFVWPITVFLTLSFTPIIYHLSRQVYRTGLSGFWQAVPGLSGTTLMMAWFTLGLILDVCALVWVGLWLSLSMKKPAMAPAMTILAVLIIPAVGTFCCLDLVADVFLMLWAITHLKQDMRWVVGRQYQTFR